MPKAYFRLLLKRHKPDFFRLDALCRTHLEVAQKPIFLLLLPSLQGDIPRKNSFAICSWMLPAVNRSEMESFSSNSTRQSHSIVIKWNSTPTPSSSLLFLLLFLLLCSECWKKMKTLSWWKPVWSFEVTNKLLLIHHSWTVVKLLSVDLREAKRFRVEKHFPFCATEIRWEFCTSKNKISFIFSIRVGKPKKPFDRMIQSKV